MWAVTPQEAESCTALPKDVHHTWYTIQQGRWDESEMLPPEGEELGPTHTRYMLLEARMKSSRSRTLSERNRASEWAPSPVVTHRLRAELAGGQATLTEREWSLVRAAFGDRCAYCGGTERICMDHVIPIWRGGDHAVENVVPACWKCNTWKRGKDMESWLEKSGSFNVDEVVARIEKAKETVRTWIASGVNGEANG